jgi:hypothetical protein
MGSHCIKTWSSTQRAFALSSAEAEFYGMIEGVTRAKGLVLLGHVVTNMGVVEEDEKGGQVLSWS